MNPHRLAFGPAYSFPFALIIALALLLAILFYQGHKQLKGGAPAVVMAILLAWSPRPGCAARAPSSGACGTTIARSLAEVVDDGANTPWKRMR